MQLSYSDARMMVQHAVCAADFGYRSSFLGQCVAILVSWVVALFVMS